MKKVLMILIVYGLWSCNSDTVATSDQPTANTGEEVIDLVSGDSSTNGLHVADTLQKDSATLTTTVKKQLPASSKPVKNNDVYHFPYNLQKPNKQFELANRLKEISGLSLSTRGDLLYGVQDEKATVYLIDKNKGSVIRTHKFGKEGDFEGVEAVGGKVFAVKSSGTIYEIDQLGKKKQKVSKFNTFLSKENDVEGLCYDASSNELLLACKGRPAVGKTSKELRYTKCVYSFNLSTKRLNETPRYIISLDEIQQYLEKTSVVKELDKLLNFFTGEQDNLTFNPSGIAIHPITKEVYVISSAGKVLIVLSRKGKIQHIEKLDRKMHQQPEGIAFDRSGNLFISNEGKYGHAILYRFNALPLHQ